MIMILGHLFLNIVVIAFFIFNIMNISKTRLIEKKYAKYVSIISLILGCIIYLIYIITLILTYKKDGFDYGTFILLLNSWAYLNASERITSSNYKI